MSSAVNSKHNLVVGYWLLCCAAVVFVMVVVGGATRLTQSGLSMVEWEPIMGVIPPLTQADWMDVFNKYRQSPEYIKVNAGMSLDEFKTIFYWEYGHRVLGRFIGLIYAVPLLIFALLKMVPCGWYPRLLGLLLLGGLQGLMGWYMVKSGLVDVPRVSQYRLTAHLSLAFIIFTCMLWFAMDLIRGSTRNEMASAAYKRATKISLVVIAVMVVSGGFVAGTKAGFIINTFPTMNGQWIPSGVLSLAPVWINLFENPVTIQFVHRSLALLVIAIILWTLWQARGQRFATHSYLLVLALVMQVSLGITTLVYKVPVVLGTAHQGGAVVLLAAALYVAHRAHKSV